MTLVSTDVEGSTELWEWDRDSMDAATKVHDRVMRRSLTHFHGYEVNTEGDSFLIAFHEPADAIAWAITIQQVAVRSYDVHERCVAAERTQTGASRRNSLWPSGQGSCRITNARACAGCPTGVRLPTSTPVCRANRQVRNASRRQRPFASAEAASLLCCHRCHRSQRVSNVGRKERLHESCFVFADAIGGSQQKLGERSIRRSFPRLVSADGHRHGPRRTRKFPRDQPSDGVRGRGALLNTPLFIGVLAFSRRLLDNCSPQVVKLLRAMNDLPQGGQILIDSQTFAAINSIIPDIAKLLPQRPDYEALSKSARARCWPTRDSVLLPSPLWVQGCRSLEDACYICAANKPAVKDDGALWDRSKGDVWYRLREEPCSLRVLEPIESGTSMPPVIHGFPVRQLLTKPSWRGSDAEWRLPASGRTSQDQGSVVDWVVRLPDIAEARQVWLSAFLF